VAEFAGAADCMARMCGSRRVNDGFGDLVRHARQQRGLTQEQLAAAVDLSVKGLAKIERDEVSPSLNNFLRIVRVLQIPVSAMATLMDEHANPQRRAREAQIAVAVGQLTDDGQEVASRQISALAPHFQRTG
jgi:transcriptional regulator with XRE-family HTH domain